MNPALNTALYSRLGGTATSAGTAVFYFNAPDEDPARAGKPYPLPYVIFDYVADLDENKDRNRTKNSVIFVRAYASNAGAAGTIDGQIDTLLHMNPLTVTGYTNFWLARENAYSLVETDDAKRKTYMAGAEYRIKLDLT